MTAWYSHRREEMVRNRSSHRHSMASTPGARSGFEFARVDRHGEHHIVTDSPRQHRRLTRAPHIKADAIPPIPYMVSRARSLPASRVAMSASGIERRAQG